MVAQQLHSDASLADRLARAVRDQGCDVTTERIASLALEIERSVARRRRVVEHLAQARNATTQDIFQLMVVARADGNLDEAVWRCFLATHFGCHPLDVAGDLGDSAGQLLCAFGDAPTWTWARVSADLDGLGRWLSDRQIALRGLRFGNHRKFESQRPEHLYTVFTSFSAWAHSRGGGPYAALATTTAHTSDAAFHELYDALSAVHRLGRLGRFDFLCLLRDAGILDVRPDSCYLRDATGPLAGAKLLWEEQRHPKELARMADALARTLDVGMDALEDALCIWQKQPDPVPIGATGRWVSTLPVLQDAD